MDTEPEARLFTDLSEDKQLTRNAQEHEESGQWMDQGKIELRDVWMRYRANLEPVLRGVSLSINAGEKIGVVGRTGAGKSSLINALFRLVEVEQGTISIDGVDISQLGLAQLRSQLAIIPQDPVLFSGTIRSNLDPFDNYRDSELWKALGRVKLKEVVSKMEGQLEGKVRNNGSNLSVGQRQLVCMARALLKESKVLVMDEATASVDNETDGLIQHTLREEFGKRTIVIIAHRLHTIMQCDKVLVMHQGTVVEFDSPTRLLDIEGGWLSKLVDDTGPTAAAHLRAMANAIEPVATSSA
jgi:ATP-binding cassette subfamily C (CFTR/MRP) protein 1